MSNIHYEKNLVMLCLNLYKYHYVQNDTKTGKCFFNDSKHEQGKYEAKSVFLKQMNFYKVKKIHETCYIHSAYC